jgi:hypothetical protein
MTTTITIKDDSNESIKQITSTADEPDVKRLISLHGHKPADVSYSLD